MDEQRKRYGGGGIWQDDKCALASYLTGKVWVGDWLTEMFAGQPEAEASQGWKDLTIQGVPKVSIRGRNEHFFFFLAKCI